MSRNEKLNWDKIKGVKWERWNKISSLTSKHTLPFSDKAKDEKKDCFLVSIFDDTKHARDSQLRKFRGKTLEILRQPFCIPV